MRVKGGSYRNYFTEKGRNITNCYLTSDQIAAHILINYCKLGANLKHGLTLATIHDTSRKGSEPLIMLLNVV